MKKNKIKQGIPPALHTQEAPSNFEMGEMNPKF